MVVVLEFSYSILGWLCILHCSLHSVGKHSCVMNLKCSTLSVILKLNLLIISWFWHCKMRFVYILILEHVCVHGHWSYWHVVSYIMTLHSSSSAFSLITGCGFVCYNLLYKAYDYSRQPWSSFWLGTVFQSTYMYMHGLVCVQCHV